MTPPHTAITGTTHGIGEVTAHELALAGHNLTLLVRNRLLGEQQAAALRAIHPRGDARIEVIECDLARLASVRAAAAQCIATGPRLTHLVNNAGLTRIRRLWTEDGFESVFAVNQLGPFLLTELLRPHLAEHARIINVASCAHEQAHALDGHGIARHGAMVYPHHDATSPAPQALSAPSAPHAAHALSAPPSRHPRYRPQQVYAQSKLANILWTLALARRLQGSTVTVHCLHPGVVHTHLLPWPVRLLKPLLRREMITAQEGARTSLYLALHPQPRTLHGAYLDEHQNPCQPSALARDEALQEWLWQACQHWTDPHRTLATAAI